MGRVQKSLFPHLNECFDTLPTKQEERLVSILEIVQVEKYVSNPVGGKKATGDAVAEHVLVGKTFSNKDAIGIVGTMPQTDTDTSSGDALPRDIRFDKKAWVDGRWRPKGPLYAQRLSVEVSPKNNKS